MRRGAQGAPRAKATPARNGPRRPRAVLEVMMYKKVPRAKKLWLREVLEHFRTHKITENELDAGIPVLFALPAPFQQYRVWCIHCWHWHHHGNGYGHRVAHCGDGSPYNKTGYILAPLPDSLKRAILNSSRAEIEF